MSAIGEAASSDLVTIILAILNVVQVVLLAHMANRSSRVRASDIPEDESPPMGRHELP